MYSQFAYFKHGIRLACGIGLLLTAGGCGGSKLPVVSGTVTLGGKPLSDATVIFMPEDQTRSPAQGTTDSSGKFTLEQEADESGIQPGKYTVRITTYQPGSPDEEPPTPMKKERVPVEYNLETELSAVIDAEQDSQASSLDFKLKSGGRIFQPAPESF